MSSVVAIQQMQFSWPGAKSPTLDIDDLQIEQGEKIFLKGPSGSGKTTLLGLIGGVLISQSGRVSVAGKDFRELPAAQRDQFRANHIGFIFQMFNLIPYLSVIENVTLPLKFSPARRQKLTQSGLEAASEARRILTDLGLTGTQMFERPVTELSVGQQQRVAAARALIGSPDLVIADEPTSALDTESRGAFLELLFKECEREQSTLVFVSHDPGLMRYFQRVVSLPEINRVKLPGELS